MALRILYNCNKKIFFIRACYAPVYTSAEFIPKDFEFCSKILGIYSRRVLSIYEKNQIF